VVYSTLLSRLACACRLLAYELSVIHTLILSPWSGRIGALPWLRGGLLVVTQILGGITAAALVSCMFPGDLNVQTTLGGGTTITQGLFIEMFLTAQLVFTIFMLAAEKHKGTFIAPIGMVTPSANSVTFDPLTL
jgi:glycerol uptake facilitator-like aquaporin